MEQISKNANLFDFYQLLPEINQQSKRKFAVDAIKFFLSTHPCEREFLNSTILKAIFLKRDQDLLDLIFEELQEFTKKTFSLLQSGYEIEENYVYMMMGRIYAIYPLLEDQCGKKVFLIEKEDEWTLHSATYSLLPLTPWWLGSPVEAVLLQLEKRAKLIFKPTPAPTSNGFLLSLWTDFVPFCAIGGLLFQLWAKKRLAHLGKVDVYGQSLGGALSLHTVLSFPEKIERVYIYAAPCLYGRHKKVKEVEVNHYFFSRDIVPLAGFYSLPSCKVYELSGGMKQNRLLSHLRVVPLEKGLHIKKVEKLKKGRLFVNCLHTVASCLIFPITSLLLLTGLLLRGPKNLIQHLQRKNKK